MTTGEKIKKRRLELGITQKDVARMIGTTGAYVSAVEKQKRGVKKETRLVKFAEALECSVDDLRSDVPNGMVDPTNDDFGAVCNCAVRYCLGRWSYMPSLVCGYITPLLPKLTDKTLNCFERDIAERKRTGFLAILTTIRRGVRFTGRFVRRLKGERAMETRPIDANALRKRIEEWMQELEQEFTVEYAYMGYTLDDVLDYIDTAPTIEVKGNV